MRGPSTTTKIVGVLVISLALLVPTAISLKRMRDETLPPQPAQDLIEVTGNVVLIGFRAVVVDVLFVQADALEKQGKIDQIPWRLSAILKLQPDLPEVWRFIGWHEMFNLSNEMDAPEDKWNLFAKGLEELERGARKCPNSGELRLETGEHILRKTDETFFGSTAAYFRKKILEWKGKNCYQLAIEWFEDAIRTKEFETFGPGRQDIWCRQICHALDKWTRRAFVEGDYETALRVGQRAVEKWDWVAGLHPGLPEFRSVDLNYQFLDKAKRRLQAIKEYLEARRLKEEGKLAEAEKLAVSSARTWEELASYDPRTLDGKAHEKTQRLLAAIRKKK